MRVYPPRPKDEEEEEEREARERARQDAVFEDEFDDASSVATKWTLRSSIGWRSRMSLGGQSHMSNVDKLWATRRARKIKNVNDDLKAAIKEGWVEANMYHLTLDETMKLFTTVAKKAELVEALRLYCLPKEHEIPWEKRNSPGLKVPFYKYGRKPHRLMARKFADQLLDNLLRLKYTQAVKRAMQPSCELLHLELGVAMSDAGLEALSDMLGKHPSLERLSFRGSCIGDHGLTLLKDGLVLNKSLKELDLTGCALTDPGAKLVVQVLKSHAATRGTSYWQEMLREYPNDNDGEMKYRIYDRAKIGDDAIASLYEAVLTDARLMQLGLMRNKISLVWQEAFAKLLAAHPSMQQIDMRGNRSSYMGVLRRRTDKPEVMLHLANVKPGFAAWNGLQISRQPVKDIFMLTLDDVLGTPREGAAGLQDDSQQSFAGGDLQDLMGDLEDPGLVSQQPTARDDRDSKGSKSPDFPSVPRLKFNLSGAPPKGGAPQKAGERKGGLKKKDAGAEGAKQQAPTSKTPSPNAPLAEENTCGASRRRGAKADITPASVDRTATKREGRGQRKKPASRSKKSARSDADDLMVKEMSTVLLQLHDLVTQFEATAVHEPHLMSRLQGLHDSVLLRQHAPQPATRQSLLQIAGELKDHCGLDDSNVWTARGRQAEVLADEH
eukprot:jgi/Tetstr1/463189/TSEL_008121.t1